MNDIRSHGDIRENVQRAWIVEQSKNDMIYLEQGGLSTLARLYKLIAARVAREGGSPTHALGSGRVKSMGVYHCESGTNVT